MDSRHLGSYPFLSSAMETPLLNAFTSTFIPFSSIKSRNMPLRSERNQKEDLPDTALPVFFGEDGSDELLPLTDANPLLHTARDLQSDILGRSQTMKASALRQFSTRSKAQHSRDGSRQHRQKRLFTNGAWDPKHGQQAQTHLRYVASTI